MGKYQVIEVGTNTILFESNDAQYVRVVETMFTLQGLLVFVKEVCDEPTRL